MTASYFGQRRIVNAAATLTRLGGSRLHPAAAAAMVAAAGEFVDLPAAMVEVGTRLAALTGNEAAWVTPGASAAITLTTASMITGPDPLDLELFPLRPAAAGRTEVIMLSPQRNAYDYGVRITGASIVEVEPSVLAVRAAMSERTAMILWFAGTQHPAPGLDVAELIAVANHRGVGVVVDAAAQIPPVASMWHYTRDLGAAAVIFSGGKGLRGPQTTGLVLGRRDVITGIAAHASPHHGIGRGMKVGKEELAGILAAVEAAIVVDEVALRSTYEAVVAFWLDDLRDLRDVSARRTFPSEAGQPLPRAELVLDRPGWTGVRLAAALWDLDPRVAVLVTGPRAIALNPQTVDPDEVRMVSAAVRKVLS